MTNALQSEMLFMVSLQLYQFRFEFFSLIIIYLEWLDQSLPEDRFDKTGKRLKVKPQFDMKQLLEGRKNKDCYTFFFNKFASLIEKKSLFKRRLRSATSDAEVLSISSEAFCLLVLENHWDRWYDIFEKSGGKVFCNKTVKVKNLPSSIQPKYTRGGLKNGKETNIGIGKGWSMEGIFWYNQLMQFIKVD